MNSKVKLNKRWKEILFAATGFGPNLLMVLMMAYFTDAVIPTGLTADVDFWSYGGTILVSTIIFPILWTIGRVFDGIVDVPLAAWTDNLKNKTGKRWISIVISVVPMIVSFVLCWIPVFGRGDDISVGAQIGNSVWIFFWSIVFFASYTLALITFYGALSDVCENQTQRARVSAYKSVFDTISYALVYAAIPAVFKAVGVPIWQVAVFSTPLMLTILIPLFMRIKVDDDEADKPTQGSVPMGESIALTLKSKPFVKWMIVNCVSFFGLQMFLVAQNALISGVMNLGAGYAAILNTCAFAPVPLMLFLFNKLRKSKGIRIAYQSALLSFGICILSFCLGGDYIWNGALMPKLIIGAVGGIIGSWGIGAFFMVPYLIPTSISAVEEEITGRNHSAMYFAVQALATSIVGAIASSLIYNYLKLWTTPVSEDFSWKSGVSLVPVIVALACIIGFFVCFLMPKKYTPRTIYADIRESSEKSIVRLNKDKARLLAKKEAKIAEFKASGVSESSLNALIKEVENTTALKIAKIELSITNHQKILDYKFIESKSIGNEEDRVIDKNSLFATVALFILTGGLFGIVSVFTDMQKLKALNVKIKWYEKLLLILSIFIPFVSIYNDIYYGKKFIQLGEEHKVELNGHVGLCATFSVLLPLFMNVVSLTIRTKEFNKISDKLSNEDN